MTLVELDEVINWLNENVGRNDFEGIIDWDGYMDMMRSYFENQGGK